jgi:hypothetical protein
LLIHQTNFTDTSIGTTRLSNKLTDRPIGTTSLSNNFIDRPIGTTSLSNNFTDRHIGTTRLSNKLTPASAKNKQVIIFFKKKQGYFICQNNKLAYLYLKF